MKLPRLYFLLSIICITISSEINNNSGEIPSLREKRSGKDAIVVLKTVYLHSALSENWMTNMVKQRVSNLGGERVRVRGFNMRGYYAAEIIVPNGESACRSVQSYARSAAKTKELQSVFFRCGRKKSIQYKKG
ncbi:unnamed protein product, partial [Mesorhabditis belari]|uniref:Uncharacterized protein n=1 Tax=Mesorhabditis belari TaxID=2138241 RepID=A0AAF3EFL2_9BILA